MQSFEADTFTTDFAIMVEMSKIFCNDPLNEVLKQRCVMENFH